MNSACEDICERNPSINQVKFVDKIEWGRNLRILWVTYFEFIIMISSFNSSIQKLQHIYLVLSLTFLQKYCKCITHCTHDERKSYSFRGIQITNIWISTSPQNRTMTRKQNVHDNFQCNWKNFLCIFSFASFIFKRHFIRTMELH